MFANSGAATCLAIFAYYVMLANPGALASLAMLAMLVVLAEVGAAAIPAIGAPRAVHAEAGAAAIPALAASPIAVRTLLVDAPLDWMRRRGVMRCYGGCLFHAVNGDGGEL